MNYFWYLAGYEEEPEKLNEIKADVRQIRLRHLLLKQIKHSKLKMNPVKPTTLPIPDDNKEWKKVNNKRRRKNKNKH